MSDKTKQRFIKSTLAVSIIVIVSKLLGFLRDALIASYFGATYKTDAFFFASSMPGIPAISMSLSTVFLPQYVSVLLQKGKKDANEFGSKMLNTGIVLSLFISSLSVALAPFIVKVLAPGFDEKTSELAITYTRIISWTLFLIMCHYMLQAILNANKIFGKPQLSGAFLNVVYIIAVFLGSKKYGVNILLIAAILGAVFQVVYLAFISRKVFKYKFIFRFDKDVKRVFRLTIPVLLGNAVIQIHEMVDQLIGSTLRSGTISVLSYGLTLSNLVKTIIINALSSVFYPYISEASVENNEQKLHNLIQKTYSGLSLVLVPISLITIICSRDIVGIVYERGNFSSQTAALTAEVLSFYAIGFVFSGLREISSKTLYSANKMTIVTRNGIVAVTINIFLSYILSRVIGVGGIALATSIAEIITAALLIHAVNREFKGMKKNHRSVIVCIVGAVVLSFCVLILRSLMANQSSIIRFGILTIVGLTVYFLTLYVLKCEEVIDIMTRLKGKINAHKS